MTFIPNAGDALGPIVVVFVRGGPHRARPDPARSADRAALRDRRPPGRAAGQHRPRPTRRRAGRVCRVPDRGERRSCTSTRAAPSCPIPFSLEPIGGRRAPARRRHRGRPRAPSTTCSTFGRGSSCSARSRWRCSPSRSASTIDFIANPLGGAPFRFSGPVRRRPDRLLDRRDDQQHQLDRRPRRAVIRGRPDRRGHPRDSSA